jgi:hypothetical protein
MEILQLGDSAHNEETKSPLLKIFLGVGLLSALLGSGFAFASWIGTNGVAKSASSTQFGQGVTGLTSCATNLNVTPENGFVQDTGTAGMFTLDSVYVSGIPQSCQGQYFYVRVYDNNNGSKAGNLTNDGLGGVQNFAKVYWPAGGDFQAVDSSYISVESWDTTTAGNAQFRVVLDPDNVDNGTFIDARNIYKVTVDVTNS